MNGVPDRVAAFNAMRCHPRNVIAIARFYGGPGREQEAAEAWAFELTCYFRRGVGEQPRVTYEDGIYTCTGLMTTTHLGDTEMTDFTEREPWDLDFSMRPDRRQFLRALNAEDCVRWDGRP